MRPLQSLSTELNAHAGLVIAALIVGLSFPAVGLISEGLPPLLLTAIRFAIAALVVWPLTRRHGSHWPSVAGLALYCLLGMALAAFFGTMFWAAHHASAVSMATIYVSVPLTAYALGRAFNVEQASARLLVILAIGASGALALIWAHTASQTGRFSFGIGETAFLAASIGPALHPVLTKLGLQQGWLSPHAEQRTFWNLLAGSFVTAVTALLVESPADLETAVTRDAVIVIYLAVFSSAVTFWLSQRAAAVLSPGTVTAYSYTAPFVAMLLLFISEPQTIGWRWLPGTVLVITAIALLIRKAEPKDQAGDPRTLKHLKQETVQ